MLDILIPHYNAPADLQMSLESVADQTWRGKKRVVLFDDGSTAENLAQVEKIVKDSPLDIELMRSPQNLGRPKARNALLQAAEARFVAWLDAGDIWYPEKTEHQFNAIFRHHFEGTDIDTIWVSCHYDWQWVGRRRRKVVQNTAGNQLKDLFEGDKLRAYLWTLLGTKESFTLTSRFDERLTRLQDLDFFLSFVRAGGRLVSAGTDRPLCCYFKSDIGRNAHEIRQCYDTIFAKHHAALLGHGRGFARRTRAKADFVAARFARNNGERFGALGYQLGALLTDPHYAAYRAKKFVLKG
ncbi:glycosyltransferase family A protein [Celeribacter naphthalenivorans]|uniref:glycosyltransferase family A protein n=1 Tax=Celeribacter naphthalenivorans TaxID=1614694 RepID=UPI001CF96A7A|nr:glycosyltransferase family 2 protein [Celeribacter naphthalenivorans]